MSGEEKDEDGRQGIQSIEVDVPLLRVLADHGAPMMLRDLAASVPAGLFPPDWNTPMANAIRAAARDISRRFGWRGSAVANHMA